MAKVECHYRATYAEISAENFASNLKYVREKSKSPFFCAMVKADAYGHGDKIIAMLAQMHGVDHLGVISIEEAVSVRDAGFKGSILTFAADYRNLMPIIEKYSITPVLSNFLHLEQLQNTSVHIEFNTAMNRMGFLPSDAAKLKEICKKQKLEVIGVMSHFANGMTIAEEDSLAQKQRARFSQCVTEHFSNVKHKHLYNSDSLLNSTEPLEFGVRLGISLYGYSAKRNDNLKPVMRLKSKIAKINQVKKGDGVSYGPLWTAPKDSLIAVLPIGYADGLKRALSNKYVFECHKKKVAQVGAVCMDYCMVDVSDIEGVKPGDEIIIFGNDKEAVYNQALLEETIPYEILTTVSNRVPRVLVEKFI